MTTNTNPYTDFVRSLTDEQLDLLYTQMQEQDDQPQDLFNAVDDEFYSRERSTQLVFFAPHIAEFKRLLSDDMDVDSEIDRNAFVAALRKRLFEKRILNGWSHELEAALKVLIIEMVEQIESGKIE